jgi:hypothetical protein
VAAAVVWAIGVFATGLYRFDTLRTWATGISDWGRLAGIALFVSWPLTALAMVLDASTPMTGALAGSGLLLVGSICGRALVRAILHRLAPLRQRCVVLGSGVVAEQIVQRFRRHDEFGLDPIGVVDDDPYAAIDLQLPLMGRMSDLREIVRTHRVQRVVIAFSRASHNELLDALRVCREERVAVDIVPRLFEFLEGARCLEQIGASRSCRSASRASRGPGGWPSARWTSSCPPSRCSCSRRSSSRPPSRSSSTRPAPCSSVSRAPAGTTRCSTSSSSARCTRRRRPQGRAARHQRGERRRHVQDPGGSPDHADRRRPARLSIDELPQLLNVLRGEMSLVGPRPLVLPEMEALNEAWHVRRLDLRPGITGPWQVSGRSDLSVHDMVRLDFQYVTGWSLVRDLEILLATVPAVSSAGGRTDPDLQCVAAGVRPAAATG